ncbi:acyl-CoA synthetase (AMP-forming)/AMP-acid ligase II [Microbacterium ginsengiterrae]|uniref:Acyl-CoA synthetase (AMP-forming)/AMP-acid ligase II n=1 Tax=Microbacterium ginsengiterrae TaxID=546115 RepID=A0A7W9CB51_9MICO|nr:AMP-binding protein [Microbacterium paludicola]MBB5742357.1 acyl-CoA synthetase (AMP-forming)/AMP-acid ligase II [Microbacterium ginsengiterrae]
MDQIGRVLVAGAQQHPERVLLKTTDGLTRTYAEFDERTTRLANSLLGAGFSPGDRIAAWSGTRPQYLELYFAVAKAGLVLVPVNSLFTEHEASFQLGDSGAVALFYEADKADKARSLADEHGLRLLPEFGDWHAADSEYETFLAGGSVVLPPEPDENALFVISYTSGTTGRPKGAMVTHRSLKNTARNHAHSYRTPLGSVCLYYSNMSFVATVLGLLISHVFVRGTIVMMIDVDGPESVMEAIGREKITFTFVPTPWIPAMTELARQHPDKWQQVRTFVHSTSKAPPAQMRRWAEVVGHRYLEGWGMTEGSGSLFTVTDVDSVLKGADADDFYASAGRAAIDCGVRIVDENGEDLPHDGVSVGELVVYSPALVVGYWNRDEITAQSFRDGWFYSGDLGAMDAQGFVYVTERRNDLIVSGGMNVYPSEVEACIAEMPEVSEVAVVGGPHERWGQTPVAFIVRNTDAVLDEQAIVSHCTQYLARYKRPTSVRFVEDLPRNASQKVLRHVLRKQLES